MRPRNCSPVSKRKTRLGVSFFLGSAAHRAAPPFELKCSGTAKPPLRNSPLRSEFTPHLRRGPEGPCHRLGCDLGLGADLKGVLKKEGRDKVVSFFLGSAAHRAAPPFRLKCAGEVNLPCAGVRRDTTYVVSLLCVLSP